MQVSPIMVRRNKHACRQGDALAGLESRGRFGILGLRQRERGAMTHTMTDGCWEDLPGPIFYIGFLDNA